MSSEEEVKDVKPLKQVQTPVATAHDIKASLVPIKREEKKTIEVVAVAPVPKHQTTTVVYLHQDLDVKAKLPPPVPNHKSNSVNHNESRQQEVKPVEEPKSNEEMQLHCAASCIDSCINDKATYIVLVFFLNFEPIIDDADL